MADYIRAYSSGSLPYYIASTFPVISRRSHTFHHLQRPQRCERYHLFTRENKSYIAFIELFVVSQQSHKSVSTRAPQQTPPPPFQHLQDQLDQTFSYVQMRRFFSGHMWENMLIFGSDNSNSKPSNVDYINMGRSRDDLKCI